MYSNYWRSPVGIIKIVANDKVITSVSIVKLSGRANPNPQTKRAVSQLKEFFSGRRTKFDLPVALTGTDFQIKVWCTLQKIGFGKTTTYSELARQVGRPKAFRAVGSAIARNPICIINPCHRVLATNGLGGYAYGLPTKKALLRLENVLE